MHSKRNDLSGHSSSDWYARNHHRLFKLHVFLLRPVIKMSTSTSHCGCLFFVKNTWKGSTYVNDASRCFVEDPKITKKNTSKSTKVKAPKIPSARNSVDHSPRHFPEITKAIFNPSNEKQLGLFGVRDDTAWLYGDYNKPLYRGKPTRGFCFHCSPTKRLVAG